MLRLSRIRDRAQNWNEDNREIWEIWEVMCFEKRTSKEVISMSRIAGSILISKNNGINLQIKHHIHRVIDLPGYNA